MNIKHADICNCILCKPTQVNLVNTKMVEEGTQYRAQAIWIGHRGWQVDYLMGATPGCMALTHWNDRCNKQDK